MSGSSRPRNLTYWAENGKEVDVLRPNFAAPIEDLFDPQAADTGLIVVDVVGTQTFWIDTLRRRALEHHIPVIITIQTPLRWDPHAVATSADHVVLLDPTAYSRHLVMELVRSREGKPGVLLLDGSTLREVL